MENTVTFTASNTTSKRGPERLATKAGLFCVPATGVFSTYKAAARLQYRTGKPGNARASVCSTAVFGGPLFCLPVKCRTHGDSPRRNYHTSGTALQRAASHSATQRRTRGAHGGRFAQTPPRIFREKKTASTFRVLPIKHYLSGVSNPYTHIF